MIWLILAVIATVCALIPAATFLGNLPLFRFDDDEAAGSWSDSAGVSVLIPARDEENGIRRSVEAVLASKNVRVEVIVLDDHSTDATAQIVNEIAASDDRVRCLPGAELPADWNGKQHACWQLASHAFYPRLVFLDADVRLAPDALKRMCRRQEMTGAALLSAFPHQETGTFFEKLIIPLMHYVLLGFLPLQRMRASTHPAYASGCGQLFMARADEYAGAGTHAAIRRSRHDGLKLPRAFREAGLSTDVIDGTDLAECRMYTRAGEVIRGVLKNAIEGIANPKLIVPFSVVLIGANVLPWVTVIAGAVTHDIWTVAVSTLAILLAHLPRLLAALSFRQSMLGVFFHSASVLLFVLLQWIALLNHLLGRQVAWRGRIETSDQAATT